jgi:hypothetical protein
MNKAVITVTDKRDGGMDVKCKFIPDLVKGQKLTRSQSFVLELIQAMGGGDERVGHAVDAIGDWANKPKTRKPRGDSHG